MTSQSAEQHITLQRLSAASEGLSTLVSIHECEKIRWKLGRQVPGAAPLAMLRSYSVLLPQPVSHLLWGETGGGMIRVWGARVNWDAKRAPPHLSRFISSLKGRHRLQHYRPTGQVMPFLRPPNQLFPVSLHYLAVSSSHMKDLNTTWWMEERF